MKTDFNAISKRFSQFGGMQLIREYARMGLIPGIIKRTIKTIIHRQSFKNVVYPTYTEIDRFLRKKYTPLMLQLKEKYKNEIPKESAAKVWSCWLQGFDSAPEIVKACLASQRRFIQDKKHILITSDNYRNYVTLPAYIEDKYKKGRIPHALFSDLIRLELLIRYGGTWIDSTVLCTGSDYPKEYLNCYLFMYQYLNKQQQFAGTSNWFISAKSNNKYLLILRDMLYQYWKDYNCTLEYYIFHRFFYMITQQYPEIIQNMPKGYNPAPLLLVKHFGEKYNEELMRRLCEQSCFHKTAYRLKGESYKNPDSFYAEIIRRNPVS